MWNSQHRQYNVDRLEVVDALYEQMNGEVSKEILNCIICDYEGIILTYLGRRSAKRTRWVIPCIMYLSSSTKVESKEKSDMALAKMFLEQELYNFL